MKKYTKIIVEIPRGEIESGGNKDDFHILRLKGANYQEEEFFGTYEFGNWNISELRKLANGILEFCDEMEKVEIVKPIKRIRLK